MRVADDLPVSVLVVGEDARTAARLLRSPALDARGVRSCDQALTLLGLGSGEYDLVLLTPPASQAHLGVEIRRLREVGRTTLVFVLVGWQADSSLIEMLDLGADDYVTEPVAPAVLAARVRARRRRRATDTRSGQRTGPLADLTIDRSARRCIVRDQEVMLRVKEFDLLDTLATNVGRVVTRSMLMSVVWDEHWFRSTKTLDVTMAGLRRQLREAAEAVGGVVPEIMTIRGVGYRLDPPGRVDLAQVR